MRSDRDLEKVLDAWLAPGPTEMPDRLFFAVLGRVEEASAREKMQDALGRISALLGPASRLAREFGECPHAPLE